MNYWANKEENKARAVYHTNDMANRYSEQINFSIYRTKIYSSDISVINDNNPFPPTVITDPSIYVDELDSVSAAYKYNLGHTCILNFASYTNPGGKFIEGSSAQEESLCHESFLYNVLSCFRGYYNDNRRTKNRSLYTDRALYSPYIVFEHNDIPLAFDVLTCAAPNFGSAVKYYGVSFVENDLVLESRINFIFEVLKAQNVDTVILGAFGCGVFKQNPFNVAKLFKKAIESGHNTCMNIVFPIPGGNNYHAFKQVFDK